jgi:hypothetical protein
MLAAIASADKMARLLQAKMPRDEAFRGGPLVTNRKGQQQRLAHAGDAEACMTSIDRIGLGDTRGAWRAPIPL